MTDLELELRAKRTGYDIATLVRVLPWIFIMRDQRGPDVLVKAAFEEARGFIEANINDPRADRWGLMRGIMTNWFHAMGIQLDPRAIETIVGLVSQAVDGHLATVYDDGLKGDPG